MFYFITVYFGNFRGGKNRGSMDPVHISVDMDGGGPWFVLSPIERDRETDTKWTRLLSWKYLIDVHQNLVFEIVEGRMWLVIAVSEHALKSVIIKQKTGKRTKASHVGAEGKGNK